MSKKNRSGGNSPTEPTPTPETEEREPEDTATAAAMAREMAERARRQQREKLVIAAAEAGLNEPPGTTWWVALAPLTEEERKLAREARDKMLRGEYR